MLALGVQRGGLVVDVRGPFLDKRQHQRLQRRLPDGRLYRGVSGGAFFAERESVHNKLCGTCGGVVVAVRVDAPVLAVGVHRPPSVAYQQRGEMGRRGFCGFLRDALSGCELCRRVQVWFLSDGGESDHNKLLCERGGVGLAGGTSAGVRALGLHGAGVVAGERGGQLGWRRDGGVQRHVSGDELCGCVQQRSLFVHRVAVHDGLYCWRRDAAHTGLGLRAHLLALGVHRASRSSERRDDGCELVGRAHYRLHGDLSAVGVF